MAEAGRRELAEALHGAGIATTEVIAYRAEATPPSGPEWESILALPPELVLLASPRTAEILLEVPGGPALLARAQVVAIGPTTAAFLEGQGVHVAATAERPTDEAMVAAALSAHLKAKLRA
jgi:uroporphyrinogen-III synthase